MFGTMTASTVALDDEEKARYQEIYCGLCHALKNRGGERCRACLTYDLTFLVMLYQSLYEPIEDHDRERCLQRPQERHPYAVSSYTDYAADLSIALAYHKLNDDWNDKHSIPARTAKVLFSKPYRETRKRIPEQCATIEQACAEMCALEQSPATPPDAVANRFGRLLADILVIKHDIWEDTLRKFADALGRFIYFMDATLDYDDDKHSGSYNPFIANDISLDYARQVLLDLIGEATQAFERLPLEQDVHMLRSVLYGGAWSQYCERYGDPSEMIHSVEDTVTNLQEAS